MMLRIGLIEAIQTPMEFILLLIVIVTLPFTVPQDHGPAVILFDSTLPWGERYQKQPIRVPISFETLQWL